MSASSKTNQIAPMTGLRAKQAQAGSWIPNRNRRKTRPPMPAEAPVVHVGGDDVTRRNFSPSPETRPAPSMTQIVCCPDGIFFQDFEKC